jgi:hypothetical protein
MALFTVALDILSPRTSFSLALQTRSFTTAADWKVNYGKEKLYWALCLVQLKMFT